MLIDDAYWQSIWKAKCLYPENFPFLAMTPFILTGLMIRVLDCTYPIYEEFCYQEVNKEN